MPKDKIFKEKILFVEGLTDKGFFDEILKFMGIYDVQVKAIGGKSKFKKEIPLYLSQERRRKIKKYALIRDADNSENDAFESCKNILLNLKDKNLSSAINEKTKISRDFYPGNPSIGIHILKKPNRNNGMLEDLLWKLIHPNIKKCIKEYLKCVNLDISIYKNYSKNKIFAFLAAQNKALGSIGVAAKKNIWDFNDGVFKPLKHFLKGFRD
ncbi:MAG: DUF3226 domain-containing protein [Promethearchaeota archaeon]